jgi:DNA-binding NtrC family response regulator
MSVETHDIARDNVPQPVSSGTSESARARTVLIVDDEPVVMNVVKLILSSRGFNLLTACTALEAIDVSRRFAGHIDLVLTDLKMPGMNGIELLEVMADERPDTRAILMTGESSSARRPGDLKFEVIYKPFVPQALLERVASVLNPPAARKHAGMS